MESGPDVTVRITRCRMNPDPADTLRDSRAKLQEFEPNRVELTSFQFRAVKVIAKVMHKDIRRGMQKKPKVICRKPVAGETVSRQSILQILDPVLHITTHNVKVIHSLS